MAKKKILTQKQIEEIIRPKIEEIKKDIEDKTRIAIQEFYKDYTPKKYDRSGGMKELIKYEVYEEKIDNGVELTFHYSANHIAFPERHGDVNWVFDADFLHGYHGGPTRFEGNYTWAFTPQLYPSPFNRIAEYVLEKYGKG